MERDWVRDVFLWEGNLHPAHFSVHLAAMGNSLLDLCALMFDLPGVWNFPRGPTGPVTSHHLSPWRMEAPLLYAEWKYTRSLSHEKLQLSV